MHSTFHFAIGWYTPNIHKFILKKYVWHCENDAWLVKVIKVKVVLSSVICFTLLSLRSSNTTPFFYFHFGDYPPQLSCSHLVISYTCQLLCVHWWSTTHQVLKYKIGYSSYNPLSPIFHKRSVNFIWIHMFMHNKSRNCLLFFSLLHVSH